MKPSRALLLVAVAFVSGCGQKGPLYLPDKNAAVVTPAPVTSTDAPAPQESAPPQPQTGPAKNPNKDESAQPPQ
jgi:predicted small lipoprotein YifL